MNTYLFIWAIMAGTSLPTTHNANYQAAHWKGQWQSAAIKFAKPEYCHKAATNLGLKKEDYRCIGDDGSVQRPTSKKKSAARWCSGARNSMS